MKKEIKTFAPSSSPKTGISAEPLPIPTREKPSRVIVVGAGAFGGWTALHLLRKGVQVTLLDPWGPGNARSSSGGESRLMRFIYGDNLLFSKMAVRSYQLWEKFQAGISETVLVKTGALWFMYQSHDDFLEPALKFFEKNNLRYEKLSTDRAAREFPFINFTDLDHVIWDREAAFLKSRKSCQLVVDQFIKEGGEYIQKEVKPGPIKSKRLEKIYLSDMDALKADDYIFACGPWLSQLFPDLLSTRIVPTRQEEFYFGTPSNNTWEIPCWVDWRPENVYYGIPPTGGRGFKIANDKRGPQIDPSQEDRILSMDEIEEARNFLAHRFPLLSNSPLIEGRVCQYANTLDGNFILDLYPQADNLWLVGGGSGHGFKHGPALGEMVSQIVCGEKPMEPLFILARFF